MPLDVKLSNKTRKTCDESIHGIANPDSPIKYNLQNHILPNPILTYERASHPKKHMKDLHLLLRESLVASFRADKTFCAVHTLLPIRETAFVCQPAAYQLWPPPGSGPSEHQWWTGGACSWVQWRVLVGEDSLTRRTFQPLDSWAIGQ